MLKRSITNKLESMLEVLSLVGPIICLIDCIVIPIVLFTLPLVGLHEICHGIGDQVLLLLVFAICMPTITAGFLKHRRKSVMFLMASGFVVMFFTNFAGHLIDHSVHLVLSALGSFLLIKANLENRKYRASGCCTHAHAHVHVEDSDRFK
ncbi:MAG TPA: MerC domain-containing protein [Oculatellaceae cyanobacterium]